ncbi:MAG: PepSY domain-containing protein [Roseburia sp.]
MINLITDYDSYEPDDTPFFAVEYTNSVNVNATIDNTFDQDWSKVTFSSAGTYIVSLSNISSGNTYNVYVYDSSMNFVAGMSCSGNSVGTVQLSAGVYYVCVASASGYNASVSYNLKIMKRNSSSSNMMYTKTGQVVELTTNALYINGAKVDMNWSIHYSINYTRNQDVTTSNDTSFYLSYLKNGTYSGPQSVSSSDCIAVYMDNFVYTYFCRYSGSTDYDYVYQPFEDGEYVLFYVDAVSGKVIDTELNYYYLVLGMNQTFTEFQ